MIRIFFKIESAKFRAYKENAVRRLQEFIIDEQAAIAPYVTCLEMELTGKIRAFGMEAEKLDKLTENLSSFLPNLEDAVARLPNLTGLIFDINDTLASKYPVIIDEEDEEEVEKCHGPIINLDLQETIRSNIARVFSSPRFNLNLLTYLRLTLFCT
jgi:hypothetical protein